MAVFRTLRKLLQVHIQTCAGQCSALCCTFEPEARFHFFKAWVLIVHAQHVQYPSQGQHAVQSHEKDSTRLPPVHSWLLSFVGFDTYVKRWRKRANKAQPRCACSACSLKLLIVYCRKDFYNWYKSTMDQLWYGYELWPLLHRSSSYEIAMISCPHHSFHRWIHMWECPMKLSYQIITSYAGLGLPVHTAVAIAAASYSQVSHNVTELSQYN